MDLYTVILQTDCLEIVSYHCHHQSFFQDKVLCQPTERKSNLDTPLVAVPNEVQHGDIGFILIFSETSSQLLDENGGGLCGTQENNHVDSGNIDALIENINRTEYFQLARIILEIIIGTNSLSDAVFPGEVCRFIVFTESF